MSLGDQLLQFMLTGVTNGSVYALMAVGFVVIYNVTGILNFAQGEFAMLGAMIAAALERSGAVPTAAMAAAVLCGIAAGITIERLAIHPARRAGPLTLIILTIGTAIALRGMALLTWGTQGRTLRPLWDGEPFRIGSASLQPQALLVIVLGAGAVWGLHLFFNKTVVGMAVRASMMNGMAARLVGIAPARMSMLAFAVSAGMGALAGTLVAPLHTAGYDMGLMLGMKGFVAAVLGGLSNAPASILGGLVVGVLEALVAGLLSSAYRDAIAFLLLILMLFVRPTGLLGKASGKRV